MLARGTERLQRSSESPRADALLLLANATGRNREWIVAHCDAVPRAEEAHRFEALCERRATGVPVAYLLGTAHFYGREFLVNESVLIPRPETEHLVDEAVIFSGGRSLRVLDVGTGCGAIGCTVAAETNAIVDATDSSRAAIALATQNACHLGVMRRCRFHVGELVEPIYDRRFDLIIANLPYVPTKDLPQRPDPASFEPREALDGGPDGLSLYKKLLPRLPSLIDENGMILLECAPPTIRDLRRLVRATFANFVISGGQDYCGLDRYVKAVAPRS